MNPDDIGFAAFLLIAVGVAILSATSVAALYLVWNRGIHVRRLPSETESVPYFFPSDSEPWARRGLYAIVFICVIYAALVTCVSLQSFSVIPSWRIVSCLVGIVVVGSVCVWRWARRAKVRS